jgi:glutamate racemase
VGTEPGLLAEDGDAPIGIFDSGVGGLTVLKAIQSRLPNESLIYLGDTARIPYGTRSVATVGRYASEDAAFIESQNVKLIVVACNTASAIAVNHLERQCQVPVLGVISPGARCAARATRNRRVAVIATEATIASRAYEKEILAVDPGIEVVSRACPLLVPLAEEGWIDHSVTRAVVAEYLEDFGPSRIDTLVLGCTHYPILRRVISEVMGDSVHYVDSGEAVAEEVALLIKNRKMERRAGGEPVERFYVTDAPSRFGRIAELFLGRQVGSVELVGLGG